MKYIVHKFEINMDQDQSKLEQFLNNLEGEVVSIIPQNRTIAKDKKNPFARF